MTNEGSWSLKKPKKHGKSSVNQLFNAKECHAEQPDEHKSHGNFIFIVWVAWMTCRPYYRVKLVVIFTLTSNRPEPPIDQNLGVNRVQPWKSPRVCGLKSFEILFLDFVNPLTDFVSVYLHLSVGQFMTRASSLSWNHLKFNQLQVRLTLRGSEPLRLRSSAENEIHVEWLSKKRHCIRSDHYKLT